MKEITIFVGYKDTEYLNKQADGLPEGAIKAANTSDALDKFNQLIDKPAHVTLVGGLPSECIPNTAIALAQQVERVTIDTSQVSGITAESGGDFNRRVVIDSLKLDRKFRKMESKINII